MLHDTLRIRSYGGFFALLASLASLTFIIDEGCTRDGFLPSLLGKNSSSLRPPRSPQIVRSEIRATAKSAQLEGASKNASLRVQSLFRQSQTAVRLPRYYPLAPQKTPDFNGLTIKRLHSDEFQRHISHRDGHHFEQEREQMFEWMNHHYDDSGRWDLLDDLDFPRNCTQPQWSYDSYPSCNLIHDLTYDRSVETDILQSYELEYLGHGYSREAIHFTQMLDNNHNGRAPSFVVKSQRFERKVSARYMHKANSEALILERLSASERTSDIYGKCGTTLLVETGRQLTDLVFPLNPSNEVGRISEKHLNALQKDDVHPMNTFTAFEKVEIALAIAESLAEMHGFPDGPMTNDDISFNQWLINDDGNIILNDCNDAIFLKFSSEKQEYCKYFRKGGGMFRSPEQYGEGSHLLDESVDIVPMGNIIFSLLTGLLPYYHESDLTVIQNMAKLGPPYIDPRYEMRSYGERRLVEIMRKCQKVIPSERVDIFEVVRHLRETRDSMIEQGASP